MIVRFWGTRGSLPVAIKGNAVREKLIGGLMAANGLSFESPEDAGAFIDRELDFATARTYGGATSCVEIETSDSEFIICDMGSGLREFGLSAMKRCALGHARDYHFFLSHLHWDHIMGFPFLVPAFDAGAKMVIHSGHADAQEALRRQQEEISFPVPFDWLKADISFRTLEPGREYRIGSVDVSLMEQRHSHSSFGYRFRSSDGKVAVYSTDSEHKIDEMDREADAVSFFGEADLVVCDTMYSLADTVSMKEDWGHSSNVVAIDLCREARARRLALFHHEPTYSDHDILRMHRESIRYEEITRTDSPLEIICAYDGLELAI